ncbi:TPA: CoA-binding protein [Candidatus Poribacteria bacterium]|nr:CoA-binding protein [Candidatus Poribacteria bacterium]
MEEVCEIPRKNATSEEIKSILTTYRIVAVVGLSANEDRESNRVARFLMERGFRIIPINPNHNEVLGQKCFPSLSAIPEDIDIEVVDIFRKPSAVPEIVNEAIQRDVKVIWMQEGIVHNDSADKAREHGLQVVMNKCMMKEYLAL